MADSNIIEIRAHGAVVTGQATPVVAAFLDECQTEISQQIFAELHAVMDARFKHPTPYYETQVINQRVGNDRVIHDRGIIYGPWLEGTSHRNQVTNFKGYHMFRLARQEGEAQTERLTEAVFKRYAGKF